MSSAALEERLDSDNMASSSGLDPAPKRVKATSRWRNSFFTGRLAAMTLLSAVALALLVTVASPTWLLLFWVIFQLPSIMLGLAALPHMALYSITTAADQARCTSPKSPHSTYGSFSVPTRAPTPTLHPALVLYLCEGAVVVQTGVLIYIVGVVAVNLLMLASTSTTIVFDIFASVSNFESLAWILTTSAFVFQAREFDCLRGHEQLQLGAGLDDPSLPSNYSFKPLAVPVLQLPQDGCSIVETTIPGAAARGDQLRSTTVSELETELRTGLYEAAVLSDHARAGKLLTNAEAFLGSKLQLQLLLLKLYASPTLICWAFARSTRNPLHVACRVGDMRMVELLLDAGMNPNLLDKIAGAKLDLQILYDICWFRFKNIPHMLGAPIHVAVLNGHTEAIQILVKHRANLDLVARTSFFSHAMRVTPVFLADAVDVLECLIHHKANIFVVPGRGNALSTTVLQRALLHHRRELASLLEEWGGDVALTPLHEAAAAGDLATVTDLLAWGVDPNVLGEYQIGLNRRTPLHWAAIMGRVSVISKLVIHRASLDTTDSAGRTPLHWATRHNHALAVEELLALGADASLPDKDGLSPLAFGVLGGILDSQCVELFVRFGADVNARTFEEHGDTCLHMALRLGYRDVALALLEKGHADLFCLNGVGQRAIECCASAELQYAVKVAGRCMDVVLSFDPAYRGFARRVQRGIEENFITVYMRDPSDDGSRSKEMMKNASVVVCVLSKGYEHSTVCMEELAFAKQNQVPVVAISCESVTMSEELQVYLYTRQIVPFLDSVTSSRTIVTSSGSSSVLVDTDFDPVVFEIDEDKFQASLRSLIDGLRDEVELRRLGGDRAAMFGTPTPSIRGGELRPSSRQSTLPGGLVSTANLYAERATLDNVISAVLAQSNFAADASKRQMVTTPSIFLSHGDCHRDFVSKLYSELRHRRLRVTVDSMNNVSTMKARILAAKDAILQCSIFLVVLSERSVKTELVSDQLAFAEDKGKTIVPIYFSKKPRVLDAEVSALLEQQKQLFVFADDTSYGRGFDELVHELHQQELRHSSSSTAVTNAAARSAAQFLLRKARQATTTRQSAVV